MVQFKFALLITGLIAFITVGCSEPKQQTAKNESPNTEPAEGKKSPEKPNSSTPGETDPTQKETQPVKEPVETSHKKNVESSPKNVVPKKEQTPLPTQENANQTIVAQLDKCFSQGLFDDDQDAYWEFDEDKKTALPQMSGLIADAKQDKQIRLRALIVAKNLLEFEPADSPSKQEFKKMAETLYKNDKEPVDLRCQALFVYDDLSFSPNAFKDQPALIKAAFSSKNPNVRWRLLKIFSARLYPDTTYPIFLENKATILDWLQSDIQDIQNATIDAIKSQGLNKPFPEEFSRQLLPMLEPIAKARNLQSGPVIRAIGALSCDANTRLVSLFNVLDSLNKSADSGTQMGCLKTITQTLVEDKGDDSHMPRLLDEFKSQIDKGNVLSGYLEEALQVLGSKAASLKPNLEKQLKGADGNRQSIIKELIALISK